MLRKRSRPVAISPPSQDKPNRPFISSFFLNPPRTFQSFFLPSSKVGPTPPTMTPNSSVLEPSRPFFPKFQNPKPLGIGLALIHEEKVPEVGPTKVPRQKSRLVVFGSQLKIQIPCSPMEFGIKTPKSNLPHSKNSEQSKGEKNLSVEDIEMSEEYTCVISHGPNPKTTHIFGNLIVESCSSDSGSGTVNGVFTGVKVKDGVNSFTPRSAEGGFGFLSFCHHCKRKIGQGEDIFMYRGERAFCSQECRDQEMRFDGIEN